jgi:hypothetical protein
LFWSTWLFADEEPLNAKGHVPGERGLYVKKIQD